MKKFFLALITTSLFANAPLFDGNDRATDELSALLKITKVPHNGTRKSIARNVEKKWLKNPSTVEHKTPAILVSAKALGFVDEVRAEKNHYTYALILGATQGPMVKRLNYLIEEWNRGVRFENLVFLCGVRKPNPSKEPLATHPSKPQSETDLARLIYENTPMPEEMKKIPVTFVHAPAAPGRARATTASTALTWMNTKPKPGTCLFVSNQPYVQRQHTVVTMFLPDSMPAETIGYKPKVQPSASLILESIAKTILWTHTQNN